MAASGKSVNQSLKEYGRGLTGGLLLSLPMLYTMELWWMGFMVDPLPLFTYFVVGISLLMVYNHYVGIHREHSFWEGLEQSMEEMGIGILLTIFILWITQRISADMPLSELSGKVIVEAVTVAIGISVGKTQLREKDDDKKEPSGKDDPLKSTVEPDLLRTVNISLCGAILIASNVAPTDEVVVIALETAVFKLLIIILLSIGIGGGVLYYINFTGAHKWVRKPTDPWDVVWGTTIMYAVSLISSAFMLWFFGRFQDLSLYGMVAETVVLAFPAALGASAGRLLIQS